MVKLAVLATAVCLSVVSCEWVEISQHQHRPRRPPHYTNTTIHEHTWTPSPTKRIDIIKTVDNPNYVPKSTDVTPVMNFKDYGNLPDELVTEIPTLHFSETGVTQGKIEKVPNVGNVKRVTLSNTPIKSPTIKINNVPNRRIKFGDNDHDTDTPIYGEFSDKFDIKSDTFKNNYEEVVFTHGNNNKVKIHKNKPNMGFVDDNKHANQPNNERNGFIQSKPETSTRRFDKTVPKINITLNSSTKKFSNSDELTTKHRGPSVTKVDRIDEYQDRTDNFNKDETTTSYYKYPDDDNSDKSNEFKVNTMENIVKFMKVVTDTISKNTKRGVNGKVKYLTELKDNLMQNIKYRIESCWPDDNVRRRSRAATATARGHVQFPSSESALMSISFLTFAVFLIKLVLQVIQTYKNKAMIMAPVMVATAGRALTRKHGKI